MQNNKMRFLKTIILIGILVLVGTAICFVFNRQKPLPPLTPSSDFNFVFRYGVGARNELNTFNQTYTKDMIADPPVTTELKLTDDEKAGIYQKIKDLRLFETGGDSEKNGAILTPCSNYYLKIQIDSVGKELSWNDCQGEMSERLRQFINYIIPSIESKEEYKKLPIPKSGYL